MTVAGDNPYTSGTGLPNTFYEAFLLEIRVNGEPRQVAASATIADLLAELKMQPRYLAVERNFELVPRTRHADCVLKEGDQLEIVTLVGGG